MGKKIKTPPAQPAGYFCIFSHHYILCRTSFKTTIFSAPNVSRETIKNSKKFGRTFHMKQFCQISRLCKPNFREKLKIGDNFEIEERFRCKCLIISFPCGKINALISRILDVRSKYYKGKETEFEQINKDDHSRHFGGRARDRCCGSHHNTGTQ